jgi:hypothetical protein
MKKRKRGRQAEKKTKKKGQQRCEVRNEDSKVEPRKEQKKK